MSLVELMIGLTIGLLIVGSATTLLLGRIREHRALLIDGRLMQDLRASADIVARDLRRAGYWADPSAAIARTGATTVANPYTGLSPTTTTSDAVSFRFSRDAEENNTVDTNEQFGFRLHNGVIEMLLGAGGWQAMTDANAMVVTAFSVTPSLQEIDLQAVCETPCPSGSSSCGPRQQVRSLSVYVTGRSTVEAGVLRSVRSSVRLRNDAIVGACPA